MGRVIGYQLIGNQLGNFHEYNSSPWKGSLPVRQAGWSKTGGARGG